MAICERSGNGYRLANDLFEAVVSIAGGTIGVTKLGALGEKKGEALDVTELPLTLRLATDAQRIDFGDWQFHAGSGDAVAPEEDWGIAAALHKTPTDNGAGPRAQRLTDTLLGPPFYTDIYYPGYCWYRRMVDLPKAWEGKPVVFVLGGYDEFDWRDYWVYLNGEKIARFSHYVLYLGPSHEAPRYVISPADPAYKLLKFGAANLLAIQARGLDRRTPEMHRFDLERYSGASMMVDQYVSGGEPTEDITGFAVADHRNGVADGVAFVELDLSHPSGRVSVTARYWLADGESSLHKKITVRNEGNATITLLEADVLSLALKSAQATGGGHGWPVRIGEDWFGGVRHPAGVAQWFREKEGPFSVRMRVIPGMALDPIHSHDYVSKTAVIGVGNGRRAFSEYLQAHGRRKPEFLNMYSLYGLCEIASSLNPTIELTEPLVQGNLKQITAMQKRGIKFDYYCIDTGWNDPLGDLKQFHPKNFPHGGEASLKAVRDLGMKPLLWISPAQGPPAFRFGTTSPLLKPDDNIGAGWFLCMAAQRWRLMLREAMLHHVEKNGVRGFKLDEIAFYCARGDHGHLPNKYGVEFTMDAFIDTLDQVKQACPDLLLMLYWRFMSPWWLLHTDTIYQRGLSMEGATPSDTPSRIIRQSVTIGLDQGHDYNWDSMPLIAQDSLGVWLSNTRWGSWMGAEGWREAWVMDFIRGNMMHQLWGDLGLLDEADLKFMEAIATFTAANAKLLEHPRRILGSPWKGEAYGYACGDGSRAIIAIHNGQFADSIVRVRLDESMGLSADDGHEVRWVYRGGKVNPDVKDAVAPGGILELALGSFEVCLAEVVKMDRSASETKPAMFDPKTRRVAMRFEQTACMNLSWSDPAAAVRLARVVNGRTTPTNTPDALQAGPDRSDERDRDIVQENLRGRAGIVAAKEASKSLVVARFDRDGIAWHHLAPHLIVKVVAKANGETLKVKTTPRRMHEQAGAWCWLVHEFDLPAGVSDVELSVEAVHPANVTMGMEVWHCDI